MVLVNLFIVANFVIRAAKSITIIAIIAKAIINTVVITKSFIEATAVVVANLINWIFNFT